MDNEMELPRYFICPISLQIMEDPVTTETGITYERDSIETWLFHGSNATCPVTRQPLSKDSNLTPNHTLRRLIQAWSATNGDRIPSPKAPPGKTDFLKLLNDIWAPELQIEQLRTLARLASESERNHRCMEDAGVAKAMVRLIKTCLNQNSLIDVVEEALNVLHLVQSPLETMNRLILDDYDFIDSLTWVLQHGPDKHHKAKIHVVLILERIIGTAPAHFLERLNEAFFRGLVQLIRERISLQTTKASLRILVQACPVGSNRSKIIEAGAVFQLTEFLLSTTEKRSNELVLCALEQLCTSAAGRAELIGHAAGLALVSKRIMRISPTVDDRAVRILSSVCKFSATREVVREMLSVGAVSKLCMLLQAGCGKTVKEKAMGVLKLHANVWKNAPCISFYLASRYP